MAQLYDFAVQVPTGWTQAHPLTVDVTLPTGYVSDIVVRVPPGPRGQVGFALGAAGQPVIPYLPGQWIVTDDEVVHWQALDPLDSGAWQVFAYNAGRYYHTLRFTFRIVTAGEATAAPVTAVIEPATISGGSFGASDLGLAGLPTLPPDLAASLSSLGYLPAAPAATGGGIIPAPTVGALPAISSPPQITPAQVVASPLGMTTRALNRPIIAIAVRPQGDGYWLVAQDGGIFNFGAAAAFGSGDKLPSEQLAGLIIDAEASPSGNGLWLVGSDGGVFTFGDARYFGGVPQLGIGPSSQQISK